jgi:hypothetical protein
MEGLYSCTVICIELWKTFGNKLLTDYALPYRYVDTCECVGETNLVGSRQEPLLGNDF